VLRSAEASRKLSLKELGEGDGGGESPLKRMKRASSATIESHTLPDMRLFSRGAWLTMLHVLNVLAQSGIISLGG